ncbi:M15 family metallopeptidase [Jeotgalibacillus marinus]|uniref:M15 family metallopeptidase n=1 Tax=Jeotgalibacillus marinus TaxID=86667 RepID=UPI003F5C1FDC
MSKTRNFTAIFIIFLVLIGLGIWIDHEKDRREELQNVPIPTDLHPIVQEKQDELIEQAASLGITVVITEGFRSVEEQDALYAIGRTTEGNIVTYAEGGESYHNFGLAIDFALRTNDGSIIWDMEYDGNDNNQSDWMEVVEIAKELGFSWGGDWPGFKDYPHFEMRFGLSIHELQRGERPDLEE